MPNKNSQLLVSTDSLEAVPSSLSSFSENIASKNKDQTLLSSHPTENTQEFSASHSAADSTVVWNSTLEVLKGYLDQQIYTAWIKPLSIASITAARVTSAANVGDADQHAEVSLLAPNKFCCEHVQRHYGELLSETLAKVLGVNDTNIRFKVSSLRPSVSKTASREEGRESLENHTPSGTNSKKAQHAAVIEKTSHDKPARTRNHSSRALGQAAVKEKKQLRGDIQETNLNPELQLL